MAEERLYEIVGILKDMGVYEDTLVILASDHGDAFPEDGRQGIIHNIQCPEVVNVKTTFFEEDIEVDEPLLSKDIIEQWMPDWPEKRSELNAG